MFRWQPGSCLTRERPAWATCVHRMDQPEIQVPGAGVFDGDAHSPGVRRGFSSRRDVYEAVESGPIFVRHRSAPNPECLVGHGIGPAMAAVYDGVEATLREELARTTLEDVTHDVLKVAAPTAWQTWRLSCPSV